MVYAYQEKFSGVKIICKFYGPRFGLDLDKAAWKARQEYEGLETLRRYHLIGSPHHVIRPLGFSRDINGVLALEYYAGEEFSHAIARATQHRDDAHLYWRLKALAYFLATQHDRTANGASVDFGADCGYFDTLANRLRKAHRIGSDDADELSRLRDRWRDQPRMWQDQQVWLHGDATPANFLFGDGMDVAAIDLERMKRGDRMFDVGRVAGELQHAFMRDSGDRHRANPFIDHFLWEYSCHFPDRESHVRVGQGPRAVLHGAEPAADRQERLHRPGLRRTARQAGQATAAGRLERVPGGAAALADPTRRQRPPFGQYACMDIRAVAFDANGTLVRILTEDGMEEIFRAAAHFLTYQGIDLCRNQVRDLYFQFMAEQRDASQEEHPEFDAVGIWRRIITEHQTAYTRALPAAKLKQMPRFLAEMYRGISRRQLGLYPYAREVLDALRERYPLALVTDAQKRVRARRTAPGRPARLLRPDRGVRRPRIPQAGPAAVPGRAGRDERGRRERDVRRQRHAPRHLRRARGRHDYGDVRFRPGQEGLPGLRARLHDHRPAGPADDTRGAAGGTNT